MSSPLLLLCAPLPHVSLPLQHRSLHALHLQPHFLLALRLVLFPLNQNHSVVSEMVNPWPTSSAGGRRPTRSNYKKKCKPAERSNSSRNGLLLTRICQEGRRRSFNG